MPDQSNKMKTCPKCRALSNSLAQRCRTCGSKLPTYIMEAPPEEISKVSKDSEQTEISNRSSEEPVNMDDYLAQLEREFSR